MLVRPEAVRAYQDAIRAWDAGDLARADASFLDAVRAQRPPVDNFENESIRLMARLALARGNLLRADSLNQADFRMSGATPTYFGMAAQLALAAGDSARARQAAERCLRLRSNDEEGRMVMRALEGGGP